MQWTGITCSLSNWPVGVDDCADKLECDALGWPAGLHGSSAVCGSSRIIAEFGSSDLCVREKTYAEAESLCTETGGRLCTAFELQSNEGDPEACGYASIFKWSWADTPVGACPSANQSLGMPGGAGSWFSFVPTVPGAYYEIQLRSEHALDGSSFTILGLLNAHGETVTGQAATLHYREDGAMMRWNATQMGGAVYVHVRSAAADAAYTMAAVQPPEYSWRPVPVQPTGQAGEATAFHLQMGGAVAVDLPFTFPFFGLEYRRVWVSSFGMLLFEEPRNSGAAFGGIDMTHSAIMAAAGEYDPSRNGASVMVSQLSPTELQVSWHAPLFSSEIFSDVSVVLAEQGNVALEWGRVDLSGGGSLGHGLVSHVSTESESEFTTVTINGHADVAALENVVDVVTGVFYGADPGEGLDLTGEFVYALNVGGLHGTVGDAVFTRVGDTAGVTMSTDGMSGDYFGGTVMGSGDNVNDNIEEPHFAVEVEVFEFSDPISADQSLASVMGSTLILLSFGSAISNDRTLSTVLSVVADERYRLQLMFGCKGAPTDQEGTVDVRLNSDLILDDFKWLKQTAHDGCAFIRVDLVASTDTIVIDLERVGETLDWSTILLLSALTLERIDQVPAIPQALATVGTAIRLVDDAYLQLPAMTLGSAIAVSAWVQVGTLWDGAAGITLFNSFESADCLDSDLCRNAVDGTLDRGGWFAVGNDVERGRPADLWTANIVYDQGTAGLFWEGARDEWMMVTLTVSGRELSVYSAAEQRGSALLTTRLPRMMRHNNYIGAAHRTPYQQKTGGITMGIADFRLYDRSLSSNEVSALYADPAGECCISAGLKDAYGVNDLDLSVEAMHSDAPSAVAITPSSQRNAGGDTGGETQGCVSNGAAATTPVVKLDMCGEITKISDCSGEISDGTGPYANSLDCGLQLEGFIGSTYTLSFSEFETESEVDHLRVFDGPSADAPILAELSGKTVPPPIVSTGRTLFLQFSTDDTAVAVGFRLSFRCAGTLVEYWKPSDVAVPLETAVVSSPIVQAGPSTVCLSSVLMSVQCCAEATMSCADARVTEIGLSDRSLRGIVPGAMGRLGALQTLKLHDNFLTGTLPSELTRLHLLRDLQLSHNQFAMQDRESLAAVLGGMIHLKTLDIGMSDEVPSFEKTLIQPTPPILCRVGDQCSLTLITRTIESVQLPHGGVRMGVQKADGPGSEKECSCEDHMDGSYACVFPSSWTSRQGNFDFTISHDGEEFVPLRTLVNPATGVESTENAYSNLGCVVQPMLCQQPHSFIDNDGAACLCEAGYYRNEYEGGWDCSTCIRGQEPMDHGTRCRDCPFGTYSSSGQACISCAPGEKPNLAAAAVVCERCDSDSISRVGSACTRCPAEFVADENRTACICPPGTYNATGFASGHTVQCLGDLHSEALDVVTPLRCVPCNDLSCIDCSAEVPKLQEGWAPAATEAMPSRSPWLLFQCPVQQACVNKQEQRCREGHTGMLCNVCEVGYGLEDGECQLCTGVSSSPVFLLVLAVIVFVGGVVRYAKRVHRAEASSSASSLEAQLTTDNPLGSDPYESVDKRQSLSTSTVQRTDDVYMLLRVLYQPVRILVGYVQVVSQIGTPCTRAHHFMTKSFCHPVCIFFLFTARFLR
eukprot:COSAG06_NODE_194_length_20530_cov_9.861583_12_plen_1626_part_00